MTVENPQIEEIVKLLKDWQAGSIGEQEARQKLDEKLQVIAGELNTLDQLKADFVSTITHELRTPIAIAKESVAQLLDGVMGELTDDQKKLSAMALSNINRLNHIVTNLLEASKIETGQLELNKKAFDMVSLIGEVITGLRREIEDKNIEVKTEFSDKVVEVQADRNTIMRVLINLMENALKSTKEGYIKISVNDQDARIQCSVEDTGAGIEEEDLPKVFGKFRQFQREEGPGERGAGVGLSVCKRIVELHQGDIAVESKIDQGSKFIFTLPKS